MLGILYLWRYDCTTVVVALTARRRLGDEGCLAHARAYASTKCYFVLKVLREKQTRFVAALVVSYLIELWTSELALPEAD